MSTIKKQQVLFLWIEKFRNFENVGFNFGSEYTFEVSREHIESFVYLKINKTPNARYIPNFYSSPENQICNISAIIGENGSGKSSLIYALGSVLSGKFQGDYILIFKEDDDFKYTYKLKDYYIPIGLSKLKPNISTIYYSPVTDFSNYSPDYPSFTLDVSSNVLIKQDYHDTSLFMKGIDDPFVIHKHQNSFRQIKFIQSLSKDQGGLLSKIMTLPEKIHVTTYLIKEVVEKYIPQNIKQCFDILIAKFYTGKGELPKADDIHYNNVKYHTDPSQKRLRVEKVVLEQLIKHFYYCFNVEYPQGDFPLQKELYARISSPKIEAEKALGLFLNTLGKVKKNGKYRINTRPILELWQKLRELIAKADHFEHEGIINASFEISYNDIDTGKFLQVYENYINELNRYQANHNHSKETPDYDWGFIHFDWYELSNGEKAYLNLFSRLFHAWQQMNINRGEAENLLIFLDEGESGFHLQWQKEYIYNLIKIVPLIFASARETKEWKPNIQIIFASHSPFSLSDIPNYNIVYLNKDLKTGDCPTRSFAANIHTLMTHSFFLKDGLVGTFAKEKINGLIQELRSKDQKTDPDASLELINIIDEPILKQQLQSIYIEKFGKQEEKRILQEQIDNLKQRLDEINGELS